ncbi:MAG: long-chain fatty acid--CoA ligase, partial [Nitrososphaera sp.]|nr:long-chain fatty acid--CoA ligase [Nitrososphaera sp.]
MTYQDLATLSNRLRDRLRHVGVRRGDRVGIYMRKSIDAVASIFGVLKVGAAYVPVDPGAPVARNAYILNDCSVKVVVVEKGFEERLRAEIGRSGETPPLLLLEGTGGGLPLAQALDSLQATDPAPIAGTKTASLDDLAYILYT